MPPDPLEGQNKISLPLLGSENFFGPGTAPPQAQTPTYGPGFLRKKSKGLML